MKSLQDVIELVLAIPYLRQVAVLARLVSGHGADLAFLSLMRCLRILEAGVFAPVHSHDGFSATRLLEHGLLKHSALAIHLKPTCHWQDDCRIA